MNLGYLEQVVLRKASRRELLADPELIERLRQGSAVWNAWREQQSADVRLDLSGADLNAADLHAANLSGTDLRAADLSSADLSEANLDEADLREADLSSARVGNTMFAHMDLRQTKGLANLVHLGSSQIELHTVHLPIGGSAIQFLRGVGVPDSWISFYRAEMMVPIIYHSCFISYSSKNEALARRLHADLQGEGVRCWFAPEDLKIEDKFRSRIDEAIHLHDKLLLILSEQAVASTWVESEVEAALEKEVREKRLVLFPIRMDGSILTTREAWAATLRRTRHIGDFTTWTNPEAYQQALQRLLRDLKAEQS